MKNFKLCKCTAVLLIITLILPTAVLAMPQMPVVDDYILDSRHETEHTGNASSLPTIQSVNLADMFDISYTPGREHAGYIFRLVEHAVVPFTEGRGIGVIFTPKNLFFANSLDDILAFVDPKLILFIVPDYVIYLDPLPASDNDPDTIEHDLPIFAPHAFAPVNDPQFRDQWNLEFIRGPAAWSTLQPLPMDEVIVAVIDSGINREHPDLIGANILDGRNFVVSVCGFCEFCFNCVNNINRLECNTNDESGHGTWVTGIIAAKRDNGTDIASMACGVAILPLRVFTGGENIGRESALAAAIFYAVEQGAHVINLSISMRSTSQLERDRIDYAAANNIWIIASVGNENSTAILYPAGLDNVIGVGAINMHGERWVDAELGSNHNSSVFVVMPAGDVLTTGLESSLFGFGGTSCAAPHITALAAIARAYHPNMQEDHFRNLLRNSAIPRGFPTRDYRGRRIRNDQYGYGIVDVGLFMYNLTRRDFFNFTDSVADVHVSYSTRQYINEAARWGLMHGRTMIYTDNRNIPLGLQGSFQPNASMWRLEFPVALGRLYELIGNNIPWVTASFYDADIEALFPFNYTRYVAWASSIGLVHGVGDNLFDPGGEFTREAAAVLFYRFTQHRAGFCVSTNLTFIHYNTLVGDNPRSFLSSRFQDYHTVSDWAVKEVAWVVASGLMQGRHVSGSAILAPTEPINRSEGAILLGRYRRRILPITLWGLIGEPRGQDWYELNIHQGIFPMPQAHTDSNITPDSVNVFIGDNITHFLSWFRGGDFANPVRDGYRFLGWYLDSGFNVPLSADKLMPAATVNLHARWRRDVAIGVVPGAYDNIGAVLTRMNIEFSTFTTANFAVNAPNYDIIFVNCASVPNYEAIRSFVARGGILYASDLSETALARAFPEYVAFGRTTTHNFAAEITNVDLPRNGRLHAYPH